MVVNHAADKAHEVAWTSTCDAEVEPRFGGLAEAAECELVDKLVGELVGELVREMAHELVDKSEAVPLLEMEVGLALLELVPGVGKAVAD